MESNKETLEQRMYCLVLRHLSGINKGIQCTHACEQYAEFYRGEPDYRKYITEDKTLIVLDGGCSPDMDRIEQDLKAGNIQFYAFKEPDLNNLTTAICFLVDERVWNREKYMSYDNFIETLISDDNYVMDENFLEDWISYIGGNENMIKLDCIEGKKLAI